MSGPVPLLEMKGIGKSFPGVKALDGVNFDLVPGEVHALMGENGAGKTTLIKILAGAYTPDSGSILLDGREAAPQSPLHAMSLGIGAIHQELDLLPYLSAAENIFIGRQPRRLGRIDWKRINLRAAELLRTLGVDIDVTAPLGTYPAAVRQMVSIARATDLDCRILIMDEPTSSLDRRETEQLFQVMRKLKARGAGIVFITHFLDQVFEVSDRITVLRNGEKVGTFRTQELSRLDLVCHMLGRTKQDVESLLVHHSREARESAKAPYLAAEGLGRGSELQPCDIELKEGEVLGLAGLLGSGRTELARLLFGVDKPTSGRLRVAGKDVRRLTPRRAVRLGVGFSPEDRRSEGIIPELSVLDNIVLAIQGRLARMGVVSRRRQEEAAAKLVSRLGISAANLDQPAGTLSGGNQQKVVLARWLAAQPRLLILDEPTRGIDVGAKAEIEALIGSLADDGTGVMFISSALEEVVRLSDRIAVMRDRAKVAELLGGEITEQSVMKAIAGDDTRV